MPTPTADSKDEIPEFLREAGWGEDTGTFQEGSGTFESSDELSDEPALAEGDLPDWVKAMAPSNAEIESAGSQSEPEDELTQDDVPDWLQGLGDAQSSPQAEQPLTTGEDLPDWLDSMKPPEDTTPEPPEQPIATAEGDDDLPDWLESMKSDEDSSAEPQEQPKATAASRRKNRLHQKKLLKSRLWRCRQQKMHS